MKWNSDEYLWLPKSFSYFNWLTLMMLLPQAFEEIPLHKIQIDTGIGIGMGYSNMHSLWRRCTPFAVIHSHQEHTLSSTSVVTSALSFLSFLLPGRSQNIPMPEIEITPRAGEVDVNEEDPELLDTAQEDKGMMQQESWKYLLSMIKQSNHAFQRKSHLKLNAFMSFEGHWYWYTFISQICRMYLSSITELHTTSL